MAKLKVVLISGKQGSGKTTLSAALVKRLEAKKGSRAVVQKFAGPLYKMHDYCLGLLKSAGIERDIVKDGPLLQLLGTEWGRKTVDENVWVALALAEIKKSVEMYSSFENLYVILDDCRFPNELEAIPGAIRVRLECDSYTRKNRCEAWRDNENHPSEISLDDHVIHGKFDLVFHTLTQSVEHCATMIAAQLDKGTWIEKRRWDDKLAEG